METTINPSTNFGNPSYNKNTYYDFEEPQRKQRDESAGRRVVHDSNISRKHAADETGSKGHGGRRPGGVDRGGGEDPPQETAAGAQRPSCETDHQGAVGG